MAEKFRQNKRVLSHNKQQMPGVWFIGLLTLSLFACEKDICGDKMTTFKAANVPGTYCVALDTGDGDTNKPIDTSDIITDAGADAAVPIDTDIDTELPSGMMDYCDGPGTCTGEADFCIEIAGYPSVCSVSHCTLDPNNCPPGFMCYDMSLYSEEYKDWPTVCGLIFK